jgi:chorismate dehydratase
MSERAGTTTGLGLAIARIPYLNAEPFYGGWEATWPDAMDLVPRRLGEEARAGRVDAGLMAAADWFSLEESFERVGALGIACRGEVESVLLLGSAPVDSLSGGRVVLTTESSTSAALVRILLSRRFGLTDVRYERGDFRDPRDIPAGESWLVIGDSALAARRAAPGSVALDLGQAWAAWTSLPFVYAVWTVRRSLPASTREGLRVSLEEGLAQGESDLAVPAHRYAERSEGRLGSSEELTRYLERFTYRLGADEERGLALFHTYWKELPA